MSCRSPTKSIRYRNFLLVSLTATCLGYTSASASRRSPGSPTSCSERDSVDFANAIIGLRCTVSFPVFLLGREYWGISRWATRKKREMDLKLSRIVLCRPAMANYKSENEIRQFLLLYTWHHNSRRHHSLGFAPLTSHSLSPKFRWNLFFFGFDMTCQLEISRSVARIWIIQMLPRNASSLFFIHLTQSVKKDFVLVRYWLMPMPLRNSHL